MRPTDGSDDKGSHLEPRLVQKLERRLGERIQRKRVERGISADRLGGELGITAQQILEFEAGLARVGTVRLIQIARLLDCHPAWFFQFDKTAKHPAVGQCPALEREVQSAQRLLPVPGLESDLDIVTSLLMQCKTNDVRRRVIATIAMIVSCAAVDSSE
jgi:transcriptional regulator with XRE-family HTH domain